MKVQMSMLRFTVYFLVLFLQIILFGNCTEQRPKLVFQYPILPDMIINESGCGYAKNVTDEQNSDQPATFWNAHAKDVCPDEASLVIDFGQKILVTNLHLYASADATIKLAYFLNPSISEGKECTLKKGWNLLPVNSTAKYVRIKLLNKMEIGEILIETNKKYSTPTIQNVERKKILMQDFIGTNAFVDVPIALLSPFGCIREYHDWPDWNEPQKDSILLNTTKNGFDFELFYANLNRLNQSVVPVIQKSPKWLTGSDNPQFLPVEKGASTTDPASYSRHSFFMNKYLSNFLNKKTNIVCYENGNEPDKWWEQKGSYFGPYQYAAMSSADKDGHNRQLGVEFGLNNKEAKLVMAGIANPKLDYLHALKYWCDVNRAGQFAWDVINFHQYSNSVPLPDDFPIAGICPEKGRIYETGKNIVSFRDKYLPRVDVWVSEFGFDTEKSPQQCPSIAGKSSDLVQADWLIRSYLLYSAAGVEKAFQFMIRDFGKDGLYATSGVYSSTLQQKPYLKPAWNYINVLKNVLTDSYFKTISLDSARNIYTIEYASASDPELKTWILWHGTEEGKKSTYGLTFLKNKKCRQVVFSANDACGQTISLPAGNTIEISETPVIIQEHPEGKFPVCKAVTPLEANQIVAKDDKGNVLSLLFDEQERSKWAGFGIYGTNPTSFWKPSFNVEKNEFVFDFLTPQHLHSVSIFDGAGEGEISFYEQNGTTWSLINTLKMNSYNQWKSISLNSSAKSIKAVISKGKPDIGEMVFYINK